MVHMNVGVAREWALRLLYLPMKLPTDVLDHPKVER